MSNQIAIKVEHISKTYILCGPHQRYWTIRDSITNAVASPFRRARKKASPVGTQRGNRTFLALNDVSFTIPRGEAVGVMGHNGAGKSTLLKILSRITEPSSGSATLSGRVGSLLEVGTGFHHELSGRDNIYLSGAILGMKRREIEEKFDEIVDFAEVGEFIDTPIKHYSSGMNLRLAFAVAAHLQPEILLIDEVLAVGDAKFQRKCLGKMEDVAAGGRTVLFVSHNLGAIKELCATGIVLSHGKLLVQGPVIEAISRYTESTQEATIASTGAGWQQLQLSEPETDDQWVIHPESSIAFNARLVLPEEFTQALTILLIEDSAGTLIVHQRAEIDRKIVSKNHSSTFGVAARLPPLWLSPGLYTVFFKFLGRTARGSDAKYVSERRILDVRGWSRDRANASLAPICEWSIQPVESKVPYAVSV
jgi:lipopolysaccharide transport system ATP-binding protein